MGIFFPDTIKKLYKSLPEDLKILLFKQWYAKQNPKWHPEGNTLKHIIIVLRRSYYFYGNDPNMILSALFHDLGKIDTYRINPKTGQPTAYGHEDKSVLYIKKYRNWIKSFEGVDINEVEYIVQNHMKIKSGIWENMRDNKKKPISDHPSFKKLLNFTNKLDGGGNEIIK